MICILLSCLIYFPTSWKILAMVRMCDHFNNVADQHEKWNVTENMQSAVMLLFLNSISRHIYGYKLLTNKDSDSDFEVLLAYSHVHNGCY